MAFKTLQNTAVQADVQSGDILAVARGTGALSNVVVSALVTYLETALATAAGFLKRSSDLSDLADAATARTNLGVPAANAGTMTGGLTLSGGMTFTGSSAQNVNALGALAIDWSASEYHTKSISANSTFTFTGITAAKAQGVILLLTISSAAVPTWPAAVKWSGGVTPTLSNGTHLLGFVTLDGGTTVSGLVGTVAQA